MSVAEAVTAATRTVAVSEVTPKKMRTSTVYKNEIVILSEVAASPCEAAAQSKDPYPRHCTCTRDPSTPYKLRGAKFVLPSG